MDMYGPPKTVWQRRGILILVISAFALLGLWAQQTQIQEVVQGQGLIVPQTRTQQVQHLEGGIVQKILVKEGVPVTKGTPLFQIHALATASELDELEINQVAFTAKKERLLAEQAGKSRLTFSKELTQSRSNALSAEKELFNSRKREFEQELDVLKQQEEQKRLEISKLKTQLSSLDDELQISRRQMTINMRLHAKGAVSESKLLDSQAKVTALETKRAQAESQIPVVQSELKETQSLFQQTTQQRQTEITDELAEVKLKLEQLEERGKSLKDKVSRTTVLAPTDGIVNRLMVTTTGGVVQPGAVLAELTPTDGLILVEGRVRAQDRGRIWLQQPVIVRVSAYDFTRFGGLTGKVSDISADSFSDDSSNIFYRVRIQLDQTSFDSDSPILAGMTVDFHIQTGERSILQMILAPLLEELWFTLKKPIKNQ